MLFYYGCPHLYHCKNLYQKTAIEVIVMLLIASGNLFCLQILKNLRIRLILFFTGALAMLALIALRRIQQGRANTGGEK